MLTDDQRMQMMGTGLSNIYNTERGLGWSRSQTLAFINFSALPMFVATTLYELRYSISAVGVVLNVVWLFIINLRSRKRIQYWQDCLVRLEPPEPYVTAFRIFTGPKSKTVTKPPWFYTVNLLPLMFLAIWSLALWNTLSPGSVRSIFNLLRERGII